MKLKSVYLIYLLSLFVLFTSCMGSDSNEDIELSANPFFVSMTFTKNDSIPGLADAVFTLTADSTTIVNVDSLPYGTRIDSVIPVIYFKTSSMVTMYSDMDTIQLTGTDTINFNKYNKIHNVASNGINSVTYNIKVNVHQVEPDLFVWKKLNSNIANTPASNQKAILFKRDGYSAEYLYYFTGSSASLFSSSNGETWSSQSLSNFPLNAELWYLTQYNNSLYVVTDAQELFSSQDGRQWSKVNYTMDNANQIHSLLFAMKGKIWALAKNNNDTYSFASSSNGSSWQIIKEIPANFPVSDYSALVFKSFVGNEKAIVLGGQNAQGEILKMNWSSDNAQDWANLGKENSTLGAISKAGIVQYNQKLYLIGGKDAQNQLLEKNIKESSDQGLSWQIPDSTYNILPDEIGSRSGMSVVLSEDERNIILIGGENDNTTYSDVWSGRINRIDFPK